MNIPNRIIKESICYSESIKKLSWFEEVFFYRLIVNCDDYGRMDARPEMLQARLFPLRRDITEGAIKKALNVLTTAGMVQVYMYDGKPFLQLTAWEKHQQQRAKKSKYPAPDDIACNQMISDDIKCPRNPNPNRESESYSSIGAKSTRFVPPTFEEVEVYCRDERKNSVDPRKWYDFYQSKGWMVGKNKMKDWQAAVRTWEKDAATNRGGKNAQPTQAKKTPAQEQKEMDDIMKFVEQMKGAEE